MAGFYVFLLIVFFLLGGLLTFLHHRVKLTPPKDGWRKFDDEKNEDS